MKKITLLFLFPFTLLSFSSVNCQSWLWATETKPSDPKADGEIFTDHSIALDNNGNTYATGFFLKKMIFGRDTLTSYGPQDLFLVKFNPSGKYLWVKQIKEDKYSTAMSKAIAVDDSENVYVTGMFNDSLIFGAVKLVSGHGGAQNAFIAKYYANGNLAWAKQFKLINSLFSSAYGYGIAADHSGNVYATGLLGDTVVYESDTIKQNNNQNFYLAKLNSAGHPLWIKSGNCYTTYSTCDVASLAMDQAGNPYIAGTFEDTIIIGKDTLSAPRPSSDLFVAKYNPAGNVVWASSAKTMNGSSDILPNSVSVDGNGDAYVTGLFNGTVSFGPDVLTETKLQSTAFISRFSEKNGKPLWGLQPTSPDNTLWQGYSVTSDTLKRGGCYILMQGEGTGPYQFSFGNDTFKLKISSFNAEGLVQFDSSGHVLCGTLFSEGGEDDGDGIVADRSGQFVYLGGDLFDTTVFGPDTLVYGSDMPFVACWQVCGGNSTSAVNEVKDESAKVKVYPNPSNGFFQLEIKNYELGINNTIEVYNILGEKVYSKFLIPNSQFLIDLNSQPNGIYLYRVISETGNLVGEGKLVIAK